MRWARPHLPMRGEEVMKRGVAGTVLAVVLAVAVVVAPVNPAAASAAQWKPRVDPYMDLPSAQIRQQAQYADSLGADFAATLQTFPVGSIGWVEQTARIDAFLESKGYPAPSTATKAKTVAVRTGKVPDISSLPRTLTSPSTIARGNAATGGFMVGWGLVDGVLSAYTSATGENPLQGICNDPPWAQAAVSIAYMFSAPDCSLPVMQPDAGAEPGVEIALSGVGRLWLTSSGRWCGPSWPSAGSQPFTGTLYIVHSNGSSTSLSGWPGAALGWCGASAQSTFLATQSSGHFNVVRAEQRNGSRVLSTGELRTYTPTPPRSLACTVTWPGGASSSSDGLTYQEASGVPLGGADRACKQAQQRRPASVPPGTLPLSIGLKSTDTERGTTTDIHTQTLPTLPPDEDAALRDTTGKGLQLWKGADNCLTWDADCAGWWADSGNGLGTGTDYRCTYGAVAVALAQCVVYRETFEPSPAPAPGQAPSAPTITDPLTGEPVEWSGNDDMNSTSPSAGPTPGDTCMDSWSAAPNPIQWVMHPVKCALVWAFVPRQSVVDNAFHNAQGNWDRTMPVRIISIASDAFTVPQSQGCQGLTIDMALSEFHDGWVDVHWEVLNACESPGADVAWWARLIGSAVLIWFTALGIVRRASAVVNAPGIGGGAA